MVGMQTRSDTRAARPYRRNRLWLLAFMVLFAAGCGDSEPETKTPSVESEAKRSANFVSSRPATPTPNPQWRQAQPPTSDIYRFPRYRSDLPVPTGNPWAQAVPRYESPGDTVPGFYSNTPWEQPQPAPQPRTYRYRPLSEKEVMEIQRQQTWYSNDRYPNSPTTDSYSGTSPDRYSQPANPWGDGNRWGSYPPARDY